MINKVILVFLTLILASCFKSEPREIKSPCVAAEITGENTTETNLVPCVRKPVNRNFV